MQNGHKRHKRILYKRLSTFLRTFVVLFTADVVVLYPNIPHQTGLKSVKEALENKDLRKRSGENLIEVLVKMAEFVLNINIFEFNSKFFNKIQLQL